MTFHSTEQFVGFYYQTFDENRGGLAPLYVRPYAGPDLAPRKRHVGFGY